MIYRILLFLVLNFAALAIGGIFTGEGVPSEWYQNLMKAPWTPPGWMFGAAWTFIMVCYSVYMAYGWGKVSHRRTLLLLYAAQWVLNVSWNPAFFYFHNAMGGLIIITSLTFVIGYKVIHYFRVLRLYSLFLLPYFIWLLVATSLNAYILIKN